MLHLAQESDKNSEAQLSTATFFLGLRTGGRGQKLLPAVVAAEVERLAIAFGVECGGFVHGHSADRVFGHGFRFVHDQVPFVVGVVCLFIPVLRCFLLNRDLVPVLLRPGHFLSLRSRALMATITVLADISTAPRAGVSSKPHA